MERLAQQVKLLSTISRKKTLMEMVKKEMEEKIANALVNLDDDRDLVSCKYSRCVK